MFKYPPILSKLIAHLGKLPAVGPKTAQKLAFHLLKINKEEAKDLAETILAARDELHYCRNCCNITDKELCSICEDEERDSSVVCIVEDISDIIAIERSQVYKGLYHVLHGNLNPMRNVQVNDISFIPLVERLIAHPEIKEIILATSFTPEGEATAIYIKNSLYGTNIKVSRIAHGIPMGANMEYIDEMTLSKAINSRTNFE